MTRYYKKIRTDGNVEMLLGYDFDPVLNDPSIVEITEEEYARICAEMIANSEVEQPSTDEISDSEALAIILGGGSA